MKLQIFAVILSLIIIIPAYSQNEQQIANELKKEGITTQEDVQAALKKRGMTVEDAKKLAAQYGIDYDSFIKTYIMGSQPLKQPPTVITQPPKQMVTESTDTVKTKKITEKKPVKIDTTAMKGEKGLKYFGYDIFKNMPGAFEPAETGPIDPGYLIGPGDVIRLYMWGAVELQYELTVDQQGNIFIPTAGQVFVSGIPYKDLQAKLSNYLSKFYQGLTKEPSTIFLDVTLAKLKPIRIFVLGEVAQPGGYTISSFATVFNALYSFGGPLTSGSLRDIRVLRNNRVLTTVDLYDYLLNGKIIGDTRLQDNDIIFIPPRGKTVSVKGEVLHPAIYELKQDENLKKLIKFAGGLKSTAYLKRAQISRIIPFAERKEYKSEMKLVDIDLTAIVDDSSQDFPMYDGDTLTVFPILTKIDNYVKITGDVYRPGTFEAGRVPDVRSLIKEAYGVKPDVFYGKADIMRTRPDSSFQFISINLGKALAGDPKNNIELKPMDQVRVYSIYDLVDRKNVSISGYVKQPVTMPYADSLTLYDLVFKAGGLQDPYFKAQAYLFRADLIRINPDGLTTKIIPFNLQKLLTDSTANMSLKPGDKVYIYNADVDKVIDKYVTIEGEVRNPGKFPLNSNMTVMDLILQAGGFNEDALKTEAYVSRIKNGGYTGEKLSQIYTVPLPPDFDKKKPVSEENPDSSTTNFKLQYRDIVVIRANPQFEPQRTVTISGEVKYPGTYVLENKRESLLTLIKKAGGPTSEAFLFGTSITRKGKRIISNVEKLYNDNDEDENILLHDSDAVFIPNEPNTVFVTGEVNNPGLYKFIPGYDVKDYVDNAGGITDSANYIIYRQANGNSQRVGFGFLSGNPEVYDGSVITVTKVPPPPPSGPSVDIAGTIKDTLAIIVSAVTIIVLAHQLK